LVVNPGSKILFKFSGAIPTPSSVKVITARSASTPVRIVIVPLSWIA